MNQIDKNTEEKIVEAAYTVFLDKGFDGTRMQHIADQAQINKSLLHYYFRTKEKLFEMVFNKAINIFLPQTTTILNSNQQLTDVLRTFCFEYISFLQKNPFIPGFIINEINKNRNKIPSVFNELFKQLKDTNLKNFKLLVEKEVEEKKIKPVDPNSLIINILSLCIFPFVASPIISKFFFEGNKEDFCKFIENRKVEVAEFVINSIKLNTNE